MRRKQPCCATFTKRPRLRQHTIFESKTGYSIKLDMHWQTVRRISASVIQMQQELCVARSEAG
jgi:hypothetical protein